jgi:hypothetical protein
MIKNLRKKRDLSFMEGLTRLKVSLIGTFFASNLGWINEAQVYEKFIVYGLNGSYSSLY